MPNVSAALFIAKALDRFKVSNKRLLDVGAFDYNGSVAALLKSWGPSEYIGTDIQAGPGVDIVCPAENLIQKFGSESFDIVICVEMLEHAENWRAAINNIKSVVRVDGLIAITTRSAGFPCHGFPNDFWRYEEEDFKLIFSDFEIILLEKDTSEPGIFILARKINSEIRALESVELYSVLMGRRIINLPPAHETDSYYKKLKLKQIIRKTASDLFLGSGRIVSRLLNIK